MLSRLRSFARNLLHSRQVETDLESEVDSYLQMLISVNLAKGMPPAGARRAALIELGGREQLKEQVRSVRIGSLIDSTLQDIRYSIRALARTPGFTLVAVLTLGLGVGANSAIFSVINAVLLRGLPFQQPDRLAAVLTKYKGGPTNVTSWKDLDDFKTRSKSLERTAAYERGNSVLSGNDEASVVKCGFVNGDFYDVFGITPVVGRLFSPGEYQGGSTKAIVLAESFWKQRFGANPGIIGTGMVVDGYDASIVGVIPDQFDALMGRMQIWAPLIRPEEDRARRHVWAVGRLRPGASVDQANREIAGIADDMQQSFGASNDGWTAGVKSLQESIVGDTRPMLTILVVVVAMVMLVACANIANLLLARGASRGREVAIRSALGASRARLVRQFLTEAVLVSVMGGIAGFVLAAVSIRTLQAIAPPGIPRLSEIGADRGVAAFTATVALAASLIFGLLPALRISSGGPGSALKEASRGLSGDRRQARLRKILVVAELAASLVLMIGCGLLVRSFYDVARVNPGFETEGVVTATVSFPSLTYKGNEEVARFYEKLDASLKLLPAQSSAICTTLPLRGGGIESWGFLGQAGAARDPNSTIASQLRAVGPGYFDAMGIPIIAGRDFSQFDKPTSQQVVILSRSLARQLFGDEGSAVGKGVSFGDPKPIRVVGVASDVKPWGLDGEGDPGTYVPEAQALNTPLIVVARAKTGEVSDRDMGALVQSIRELVRSIDSRVAVSSIKTVDQIVDASLAERRFYMMLMTVLGGLSFVLAAIGAYGVISYSVAERTQEIGIRMALGAKRREILTMVLGQGLRLAIVGTVIGAGAALAVTTLLRTFLFRIGPRDPITFVAVSLFLILMSLLASYIPARRATKVDPISALRFE